MSNTLSEVIKHLPGQHTQQSHGRKGSGGEAKATDGGGSGLTEGTKITFYRKGGRRPGTVIGKRGDGRLDVKGEDGKKYIVDPNRKRTKVKIEGKGDEPKKPETKTPSGLTPERMAKIEADRKKREEKKLQREEDKKRKAEEERKKIAGGSKDDAQRAKDEAALVGGKKKDRIERCKAFIDKYATPVERGYAGRMTLPQPMMQPMQVSFNGQTWIYEADPRGSKRGPKDAMAETMANLTSKSGTGLPGSMDRRTRKLVFTEQTYKYDSRNKAWGGTAATGGVNGTITVYNNGPLDKGTYAHETAHNAATFLWNTPEPPRGSNWRRLYDASRQNPKAEQPVRDYGTKEAAEDMATAFQMYAGQGITGNKGVLKARYPKRYQAVQQTMNQVEEKENALRKLGRL